MYKRHSFSGDHVQAIILCIMKPLSIPFEKLCFFWSKFSYFELVLGKLLQTTFLEN